MGAAPGLPDAIADQLASGGIAVMPVARGEDHLVVRLEKQPDGNFRETPVMRATLTPLQPGVAREL
jgi:protein-L-isoaspartate O-methyltransferase